MAELIPSINFAGFHKLKADQLRRMKSAEITFNGEYLFTFVNGMLEPSGYLRTQSEYNCQLANSVGGETLEQILGEVIADIRV